MGAAILVAALLVTGTVVLGSSGVKSRRGGPSPTASGRHRPTPVPLAARGPISSALGDVEATYHIHRPGDAFEAVSGEQGLHTRFTPRGVTIHRSSAMLGLRLADAGFDGAMRRVGEATPTAHGNRVTYSHPGIREWYANGPLGIEQGFSVARDARGAHELRLSMAITGRLHAVLGDAGRSVFFERGRHRLLQYGDLVATDSRGRRLGSSLALNAGRLELSVDVRDAVFPVRIDPIVQAATTAKLTPSDAPEGNEDELGSSVAVSGDGSTVVAGAPDAAVAGYADEGAVYVFTKPAGGWAAGTETARLTASDAAQYDNFGASVGVTDTGSTVMVGASGANGSKGAVYVFTRPSGGWSDETETTKLTALDGAANDQLGYSVGMDQSGLDIVAGAPGASVNGHSRQGAVYEFSEPSQGWSSAGAASTAKLTASDGAANDALGTSVAISSYDTTIVAGAPSATVDGNSYQGAIYLFHVGSEWSSATQTAKLTASDGGASDELGMSVGVSDYGASVVAGASNHDYGVGAAYIWTEQQSAGWSSATETAELTGSDASSEDNFGHSVAISPDGSTVAVGAYAHTPANGQGLQGAVYGYVEPSTGWSTATESGEFLAPDGAAGDELGRSVSLSDTGSTIAAGAPDVTVDGNRSVGAAYVFASWQPPTATISNPTAGGAYTVGQRVATNFNCADAPGQPGLQSCTDSGGATAASNGYGSGTLDTSSPGAQTYTVTAVSQDGLQTVTTLHYTVLTMALSVSPSAVDAADAGSGTASSTSPVDVDITNTGASSGTVDLTNQAGANVGTVTLGSDGTGSATLTGLVPDSGPLTATLTAGSTHVTAQQPLRVGFDPVTISLASLPPVYAGSPLTVTGTITAHDSGDAQPSGTITVHDGTGGPVVGTAPLNGSSAGGAESFSVSVPNGLASGSHTLEVDFADSENRFASGSRNEGVTATSVAYPTMSLTVSPSAVDAADNGSGTATSSTPVNVQTAITRTQGAPSPTGNVVLTDSAGRTVGTMPVGSDGTASTTLTGLAPDSGPLQASFGSGASQISASQPLRVGLDPVTVSLHAPPPLATGLPVTVTGTITAQDAGDAQPSGTITVHDGAGGAVLGTAQLRGSSSGGSEAFSVSIPNGITGGQHTLMFAFADGESRFAPGTASEDVTVTDDSDCYPVIVTEPSVPTRVNGLSQSAPVLMDATPTTDACGSGTPPSVRSGGYVALTAHPPADETLTGFSVTAQSGTTTLAVDGHPGAGSPGSTSLTVTGPVTVTPLVTATPPACVTLSLTSQWLGGPADQRLAGFAVTGETGCAVQESSTTTQVTAGGTIQALPGTPLSVSAQSVQISSAMGLDDIVGVSGVPSGGQTSGTTATFALNGAATVTATAKMVCTALPTIGRSTGGTTTLLSGPSIAISAVGAVADMLPDTGNAVGLEPSRCPSAWATSAVPGSTGALPGSVITYLGTPAADDPDYPAGNPEGVWGVDSWQEADATSDAGSAAAATALSASQLTPHLTGTEAKGGTTKNILSEPPATGTDAEPTHPVAVGFRFQRLGCVKVATDVASWGRDSGGVDTLGGLANGSFVSPLSSVAGSLVIDTKPNCPAVGPGYYLPGTQIHVTASDPAQLGSYDVLTSEQHRGAYDGTGDSDLVAPAAPDMRAARTEPSAPLPPAAAKKGHGRSLPKNLHYHPKKAPRPAHVIMPPAGHTVPSEASARAVAVDHILAAGQALASQTRRAAASARAEQAARQQVEAAEHARSTTRLAAISRAWGPALERWWHAQARVIADQSTVDRTVLAQFTKLGSAQVASSGLTPSYAAVQIAAGQDRVALTEDAVAAASNRARRIDGLRAATARALTRRGNPRLRAEYAQLKALAAPLDGYAAEGPAQLRTARQALAALTAHETRGDRSGLARINALAAAGRRAGTSARGRTRGGHGAAHVVREALATGAGAGIRPLYPDERQAGFPGGDVAMPLQYQGLYADDTDGLVVQRSGDHTATFTVGSAPMTVHATWGPSDCETPTILPYDASQVTVSVDGGSAACAGPGTVARFGTFAVNATPSGPTVAILVVHGTAPDGTDQERVQLGSGSFPALYHTTVQVQVCQPIELGGAISDTRFGGNELIDGTMIDQFTSVVPGTGSPCAIPGFYTVGSQVRFSLPANLQQIVGPRDISNPYQNDYPCRPSVGEEEGCTDVPAAGTADWTVDGHDVGSTPPTLTLNANQPQHAVDLQINVACARVAVTVHDPDPDYPAPILTPSDCPVQHNDAGSTTSVSGYNTTATAVGYYLPNTVPAMTFSTACQGNQFSGMPYQPIYGDTNSYHGQTAVAGTYYANSLPGYAYGQSPYGFSSNVTITDNACGGSIDRNLGLDWNIPTLTDVLGSVSDDVYDFASTYIAPVFVQYYRELDTVFTTNPFSSLNSFETWAKSAGLVLVTQFNPAVGALLLGADYTGALSDPSDFATYLGQVGRFVAASGVQAAFTIAQTAGLGAAAQLALSLGDLAVQGLASGLASIGAPSGLVSTIRAARVLTNGINAIKDCTTEATAGDTPPDVNQTSVTDDSLSALGTAIGANLAGQPLNAPPPLAGSLAAIGESGSLSAAGSILSSRLKTAADNSGVGIVLGELGVLHTLPGADVNWSASDYANCLAADTIG